MPLIQNPRSAPGAFGVLPPPNDRRVPDEEYGPALPEPDFWKDVAPAVLQRDFFVFSIFSHRGAGQFTSDGDRIIDPKFDPFSHISGYEPYADSFTYVNSLDDVDKIKRDIDRERENDRIIRQAGVAAEAFSIGTSLLLSTALAPLGLAGGIAAGLRLLPRLRNASNLVRVGIAGATASVIENGVNEALLYSSQHTRTLDEALANVAVGAVLDGAVGVAKDAALAGIRAGGRSSTLSLSRTGAGTGIGTGTGTGTGASDLVSENGARVVPSPQLRVAMPQSEINLPRISDADQVANAVQRDLTVPAVDDVDLLRPNRLLVTLRDKATDFAIDGAGDLLAGLAGNALTSALQSDDPDGRATGRGAMPRQLAENRDGIGDVAIVGGDDQGAPLAVPSGERREGTQATAGTQTQGGVGSGGDMAASPVVPDRAAPASPAASILGPVSDDGAMQLKTALGLPGDARFEDPMLRAATSNSVISRRIMQELGETPLQYADNALGVKHRWSAETEIRMAQSNFYNVLRETDDAFVQYRQAILREKARSPMPDAAVNAFDRGGFNAEIGRSLRHGGRNNRDDIAKIAQAWQQTVFAPLAQDALDLGLLPTGIDKNNAVMYLARLYDGEKIGASRDEFTGQVARWLKLRRRAKPVSDAAIADMADELVDRIVSVPEGRLPYDAFLPYRGAKTSGDGWQNHLSEQDFLIPESMIADFLENDINVIARIYGQTMNADIILARRFGSPDMKQAFDDIDHDYGREIALLADAGLADAGRGRALAVQRDDDMRSLAAIRDRLRGAAGLPRDPFGVVARAGVKLPSRSYRALMGRASMKSIPAVAYPVLLRGFEPVMADAVAPMIARFRKTTGISPESARKNAIALGLVLDSRKPAFADLADDYGRFGRLDFGNRNDDAGTPDIVTLFAPWGRAITQFAGLMAASDVLDGMMVHGTGDGEPENTGKRRKSGVSDAMAGRIAAQFDAFGRDEDGLRLANTADWQDRGAARAFRQMVQNDVRQVLLSGQNGPTVWLSSETAMMVDRFITTAIATSQRLLQSGLEKRDAAFLSPISMMMGLGMLSQYLENLRAGIDGPDQDGQIDFWLDAGIERSGALDWLFQSGHLAEKLARNIPGVAAISGVGHVSDTDRFSFISTLMAPASEPIDGNPLPFGFYDGTGLDDANVSAAQRLLPFYNLAYLRNLLDIAGQGLNARSGPVR